MKSKQLKSFKLTPLALAIASAITVQAQAQQSNQVNTNTTDVIEVIRNAQETNPKSVKFTRPLLDTAQTVNVVPAS